MPRSTRKNKNKISTTVTESSEVRVPELQSLLGGNVLFSSNQSEEEVFHQKDLIELKPFGVSLTQDMQHPYMLLKDSTHELTLPVAIHPIEASLVLNLGHRNQLPYHPHHFLSQLIQKLDIKILQCVFIQIKGTRQFVRLYLAGMPKLNSIKLQADQALSLCVALNVPIFATRSFINQSKLLNAQIEGVTSNLLQNQKILLKNSSYIQ